MTPEEIDPDLPRLSPCPACPDCGHNHRASNCMCGCTNDSWKRGPQPIRKLICLECRTEVPLGEHFCGRCLVCCSAGE